MQVQHGPQQQLLARTPSRSAAAWCATRSTPCSTPRAASARSTASTWPAAGSTSTTTRVIDHAKPHCASHELYKGILDGKAHGVFNGKIFVRQDAQKTDAKQTNQTLLLSDDAVINTKPQLEIFADDVKCTHGATVGQLDEEAIFYLRARGIGREEARSLLTFAFANDVIGRIKVEPLRAAAGRALLAARHLPRSRTRRPS